VIFVSQPFNLRAAVEEIAAIMSMRCDDEALEIVVHLQPGLPETFSGDDGRIRQILTNLVGNAVKFTKKGHILIAVSGEVEDGNARLLVKVTDTGIGVPADKIDSIFDKFSQVDGSSTREFEGTGLGLAICRMLVDGMGGAIGVESTPDVGSTFWFTLALPLHGVLPQRILAPASVRGARVLVVDDNEVNRAILLEQLEGWRFTVSATASGLEALTALRDAAGAGRRFDLVVLDFQMPGMDGAEVAEAIRGDVPIADTPIVLLSSVDQAGFDTRAGTPAFQEILMKPARSGALFEAIVCVLTDHPVCGNGGPAPGLASDLASDLASGGAPDLSSDGAVKASSGNLHRSGVHVLIVEDNAINQLVAAEIMGDLGHEYTVVSNGQEALDYLALNQPDIVLMDVSMPVMNGLDATRAIRRNEAAEDGSGLGEHLPIVGLTAHALQGDRERCLAVGMDAYLSKPVEPDELGRMIGNLTSNEPGERSNSQPARAPTPRAIEADAQQQTP
jgi:CheY-like chemotaxis protein